VLSLEEQAAFEESVQQLLNVGYSAMAVELAEALRFDHQDLHVAAIASQLAQVARSFMSLRLGVTPKLVAGTCLAAAGH